MKIALSRTLASSPKAARVSPGILAGSIATLVLAWGASTAHAVTYYWNTTTTNLWSSAASWSNNAASGGTTGTVPGTADLVVFNQSSINGNQTVTLGAATTIGGITFANTGTTLIQSSSTTSQTLTIGASGITRNTGSGAVTIGNATNLAPITLSVGQSWTNNASTSMTIVNTLALGANALTFAGTGTGGTTISGLISGSKTAATTALAIGGSGAVTLSNTGNTFTGDITVTSPTAVLVYTGGTATTTSQLGTTAGTAYKQVTLTNGGIFRVTTADYNVNAVTATNKGAGAVFAIGTGGGTFDVTTGRTFTIDDGTGAGTALTASQLQGSGTLTKIGAGTLSLGNGAASNAVFTGQILVNEGILKLGTMSAAGVGLGSTAANTVIASGAAFDINNNASTIAEPVTLNGTGISNGNVLTTSHATGGLFAGPLTLGSASTIGGSGAGTITLSGGVGGAFGLTINNLGAGGTTLSTVSVNNGGTITNSGAGAGDTTISAVLGASVTGVIQNSATSELLLSGNNSTFAGGVTINAGTVTTSTSANALGTGTVLLGAATGSAAATLNTGATALTFANAITVGAGSGLKTLAHTGTVAVTYSGLVTLNGDLTVNNASSGSLTLGAGGVNLNNRTLTLSTTGASRLTSSGVISGAGSVIVSGTGVTGGDYVPNTQHTYSGGTSLATGSLTVVGVSSTGTPGSLDSGPFGTGTLTLNGGQLRSGATAALTAGNALVIAGNTTFPTVASEKTLTLSGATTISGGTRTLTSAIGTTVVGTSVNFSGAIGDGGLGYGLIKEGAGTVTFSGVNTYGGNTSINAGILTITSSDALPGYNTNGRFSVASGAILGLTNGVTDANVTSLLGTTNFAVGSALGFDTTAGDRNFATSLTNTAGGALAVTKIGTGKLTLSGANSYSGPTTVTTGTLQLANPGALYNGNSANWTAANVSVASGTTLAVNMGGTGEFTPAQTNALLTGLSTINANGLKSGSTFAFDTTNAPGDVTYSNVLTNSTGTGSGAVNFTKLGAGTLILDQANTYSGSTNVASGTLTLSGNRTATAGTFNVGNALNNTGTLNVTNGNFTIFTAAIGAGDGTAIGIVNHSGGTLTLTAGQNQMLLGTGAGTTAGTGGNGTYNLSGGTLTGQGSNSRGLIIGTNAGTTGTFNLSGGTLAMGSSAMQVGRSDSAAVNSSGTFNQTGGTAAIGFLTVGGGSGATFAGTSGTLNLTGGTFSAGAFSLLAAGDSSTASITIGGTAQVTLPAFPTVRGAGSTATLVFDGGTLSPVAASASYIGGLTSATLKSNGAKFDVAATRDITVSQALLGDVTSTGGGLTKLGLGTLTLTGASTYTGATTVSAGTLAVTGTGTLPATSGLSVASGARFTYVPTTSGTLNIGTGGTLSLATNSNIGAAFGATIVAGTATVGSTVNLVPSGAFTTGTPYTLLTASGGGLNGATYNVLNPTDYTFTTAISANSVAITPTSATALTTAYWLGGLSGSSSVWAASNGVSNSNWTTDGAGTATPLVPGAAANVTFSDASALAGNQVNMTLGTDMAINSLTIATSNDVSLLNSGGSTLTVGSTAGSGLTVNAGAGAVDLSASIVVGNAQTWTNNSSNSVSFGGVSNGANLLTMAGTGTSTIANFAAGTGGLTVSAGTTNITAATLLGTQSWNNNSAVTGNGLTVGSIFNNGFVVTVGGTGSTAMSGVISGTAGLTKTGAGTLTLSGSNTYNGTTTLTGGVLEVANANALGSTNGGITQSGSSEVRLTGGIIVPAEALTINGGGIGNLGALRNFSGDNTWSGTVTMAAQSRINSDSGTLTLGAATSVSATNLTLVVGGAGNVTINGAVSIGTGGVSKADGAGTLTLAGASTYTGATAVVAGTLTLASTSSLVSASSGGLSVAGAGSVMNIAGTYSNTTGAGSVTVGTGGTLNFSGTGSYTGSGEFLIGSGSVGTFNMTGGTLTINSTGVSSVIASTAQTTLNGIRVGNGNAGNGTLNLSGGTLTVGSTGPEGGEFLVGYSSDAVTPAVGVVTVSGSATLNIGGGGGRVFVGGSDGTATTSGGTGTLTINGGTVNVGAAGTFPNDRLYLSGYKGVGTLDLNGGTFSIGRQVSRGSGTATVNFNGGLFQIAGAVATIFPTSAGLTVNVRDGGAKIDTNGFDTTISASLLHSLIDGAVDGGLTKSGAGTLIISGANTYNGNTVISGGTLQVGAGATVGSILGNVTNNGTLAFSRSDALTFDGLISGSGALIKSGAGTLTLTAAHTYTGATTINGGTLSIDSIQNAGSSTANGLGTPAVGASSIINMAATGGLRYTGSASGSTDRVINLSTAAGGAFSVDASGTATLTLSGGITNAATSGASTITLTGSGNGSQSGSIANGTGTNVTALTKTGAGTWTLSGTNTYSGATNLQEGTLVFNADQVRTGALVVGVNGSANTAALDSTSSNTTFTGLTVQTNSATANTITIGAGKTMTINGNVTFGNTLSTGNLGQTVANFVGGGSLAVNASGGTFEVGRNIGTSNNTARATVDLSALASFSANLGATGTFVIQPNGDNSVNGASTITLSNTANTITAANLNIGASTTGAVHTLNLGNGTNVINVDNIRLGTGNRETGVLKFAGSGGTLTLRNAAGTGRVDVTMGVTVAGTTAYGTNQRFDTTGGTADVAIGTLAMDLGAKTAANTTDVVFSAGTLDIKTVNMAVAKGTGTSVHKIAVSGGTVKLGGSSAFGDAGTGSVSLATNASGELAITGGSVSSTVDITRATGTGTGTVTLNGGTLDLLSHNLGGVNALLLNFQSGTLQNVGQINAGTTGLTKSTSGTLTIAGTNTYGGVTSVLDGTLLVSGSLTGAVTVDGASSILGGGGSIGALNVQNGGSVSPGASAGKLTVNGAFDLGAGTHLKLELNSTTPETGYDVLSASGTITLAGDLSGSTLGLGYTPTNFTDVFYVIINSGAGSTTGTLAGASQGQSVFIGGQEFAISYNADSTVGGLSGFSAGGNDVALMVVPEPTSLLSLLGGLASLLGFQRLRRRRY